MTTNGVLCAAVIVGSMLYLAAHVTLALLW